jgi:hypothetical protein
MADDVQNRHLESGSRRALVGLFGEGWVHQEFSSLPLKICESILPGLVKRARPLNFCLLLNMVWASWVSLLNLGETFRGR